MSQGEFYQHKRKSVRISAYMNRLYLQLSEIMDMTNSQVVWGLFDKDGVLLKLYGQEENVAAMQNLGIRRNTVWTLDTIGPNAVTVGLKEQSLLYTMGEENFADILHGYAVYFAPASLINDLPPYEPVQWGGVALFVPVETNHPDYALTVSAAANDLMLHLNIGGTLYEMYEHVNCAMIIFDINQYNNKIYTAYHNKLFFDIMNVPPEDIFFKPADQFFDPFPYNWELWEIIREKRRLSEHPMTLSIHGKEIDCIVSSEPHRQPTLSTQDVRFYITTPKKASEEISRKTANNAILSFDTIVGRSEPMQQLIRRGKMIAQTNCNVMILGESGVGKDVFAQSIHNSGSHRDKPFIAVNCGALPRDLIASELFGYEGGAFTGAKRQGNIGKFELANGGTIFLDEIGELPLDLQPVLLRAVESKRFMRVGGKRYIDVDVKIICATNVDLSLLIRQKKFRSDLYYRLSTVQLNIPPLRERADDIIPLAEHFVRSISRRIGRNRPMQISPEAQEFLTTYNWPGNVRELQNIMECLVQLYPNDPVILPEHIQENLYIPRAAEVYSYAPPPVPPMPAADNPRRNLTTDEIQAALVVCNNNRSAAARYLGIARKTLYRNMERLGME